MIYGADRDNPAHAHAWLIIRGAPAWMPAYGLAPATDYAMCWGCGTMRALEIGE